MGTGRAVGVQSRGAGLQTTMQEKHKICALKKGRISSHRKEQALKPLQHPGQAGWDEPL